MPAAGEGQGRGGDDGAVDAGTVGRGVSGDAGVAPRQQHAEAGSGTIK